MPILRKKNIRTMALKEHEKKLMELRTELVRLKTMVEAGGAVENPAHIGELRKTIARILTIEHEKRLGKEERE